MNDSRDTAPQAAGDTGLKDSVSDFVQARLQLIRLEAKEAGRSAARKIATLVVLAFCALLTYLLLMVGLIGWIAAAWDSWSWFGATFAFAGLHLLVAVMALVYLKKPSPPAFQITRSELSQDKAWITQLKNEPKSPN